MWLVVLFDLLFTALVMWLYDKYRKARIKRGAIPQDWEFLAFLTGAIILFFVILFSWLWVKCTSSSGC
jgi:hypothetical protein